MNSSATLILFSALILQLTSGQYFPHRMPKKMLYLDSDSQNTNPFAKAYEDQGYYQKYQDYGRQQYQPVPQTPKKVNRMKKEKEEKVEFDYFEGSDDEFKSPNLDYNDALGFKDFDPFKFVQDGVAGIEKFTDIGNIGNLGTLGDDDGYGYDYNEKK